MSATSIRFACENCGRELRARSAAAGRRVRCPGCGDRTHVRPTSEAGPARSPGVRIGWPWFAGAGAFVVLAAVAGIAIGTMTGRTPRAVADTTPTGTAVAVDPPAKSDPPAKPNSDAPPAPKSKDNAGGPVAAAKPADWKATNAVVRTGARVQADFNRVLTAEDGYEMVEVFCDMDAAEPTRTAGFDVLAVTLAVLDGSKADAEPVRRAAIGFSMFDDGPDRTSYMIPTTVSVGKAGDSFEVSQSQGGVALKVYARATGDQTGPVRLAPKQNPTRLGFVFTVPKGSKLAELRVADAVVPLGSGGAPAPGGSDPDLQGTWKLVKVYDQYEPGNQSYLLLSSYYQMTIQGTEMAVETEDGGNKKTTRYTLATDRAKSPRAYHEAGADGKTFSGIYKVEGNKLLMCSQKDGKPPADFTAKRDDGKGRRIMEYERVKP